MPATVKAGSKSRRTPLPPPPRALTAQAETDSRPVSDRVLRLSSTPDEAEKREPLFYLDDVEYTIPVDPPASIGLQAMHLTATGGATAGAIAEDYIMSEMLGADGWAALRGCKTLTHADYRHLVRICTEKAMGAAENDPNP